MNAPTGTLDAVRPPRGRAAKIAVVTIVTVGAMVATFAIVSVVKATSKGSAPGSADATPAVSPPDPSRDAPARPDAPPPADAPIDVPIPVDAPLADAYVADAPADAKKGAPAPPLQEKKYGSLAVTADPIVTVFVDRKKYGDTPITIKLAVGRHVVQMVNRDSVPPIDDTRAIKVVENQTVSIHR